jgi:Arsenical pump membrane protein
VLWAAVQQTWEPFVLVVGLLLIGHVASTDGLFEVAGSKLSRLRGGAVLLFVSMMLLTAVVTATLNLDTSVVFLTPVLLQTARHRSVDESAFLYGSIFMANAASLLLLGSNLTNVLVFSRSNVQGAAFARTMFIPWLVSIALTTLVVLVWRWRELSSDGVVEPEEVRHFTLGPGLVGVVAAVVVMLALSRPALPVLGIAIIASAIDVVLRHRLTLLSLVRSANLPMVVGLFVLLAHYPALDWNRRYVADRGCRRGIVKRDQQSPRGGPTLGEVPASPLQLALRAQPWSQPERRRRTFVHPLAPGGASRRCNTLGVDVHQSWWGCHDTDARRVCARRLTSHE